MASNHIAERGHQRFDVVVAVRRRRGEAQTFGAARYGRAIAIRVNRTMIAAEFPDIEVSLDTEVEQANDQYYSCGPSGNRG